MLCNKTDPDWTKLDQIGIFVTQKFVSAGNFNSVHYAARQVAYEYYVPLQRFPKSTHTRELGLIRVSSSTCFFNSQISPSKTPPPPTIQGNELE